MGPLHRWLLFAGVVLVVGVAAWRTWIAPAATGRTDESPPDDGAKGGPGPDSMSGLERRAAGAGAVAVLLLLPVWGLRMYAQVQEFRDPFVPLSEDLAFLIREMFWGWVWVGQGVVLVGLLLVFMGIRMRPLPGATPGPRAEGNGSQSLPGLWKTVWVGTVLLVLTLSLSSHAMSVPGNRPLAVAMDASHTLAAGTWIGSLALILLLSRPIHGYAPPLAPQLRAFSPVAMVSVAVLLFMGTILAAIHLGEVAQLWNSTYGRVLSAKIALAGIVLLLGLVNWRKGLPKLSSEAGRRSVYRRAGLEVGAAALVLLVTGVLTGTSMPAGTH